METSGTLTWHSLFNKIISYAWEGRYESEQPEYHDNHGPEKIV